MAAPPSPFPPDQSEKVDYAKNMAKGYLRSVGSGEYAPPEHNYVKDPQPPTEKGKVTKWKRMDSDEFDFWEPLEIYFPQKAKIS